LDLWDEAAAEHFRHIEEIGDIVNAQTPERRKAASSTSSLAVRAPGVGSGSSRAASERRLDDDDRFGKRDFAGGRQNDPRVTHGFHVDEDALGVRVVAKSSRSNRPIDIKHRAGGNDGAEANLFAVAPVENSDLQSSTLTQERNVAGLGSFFDERGVQPIAEFMMPRPLGPIKRMEPPAQLL